ncbi:Methyltransferase domain-containing protein [Natronoarchaeum philippinense]|uniref:Methyltransferase domain-containing protein n=1 Tax=Natronoarchaeum philippinense TaxID=558529 RepID=A0A285NGQ2_NATPI|nr:methyltransferase domain-containing protein [Natronoarchaeum philippinense]SNZ06821.1 Methyltransferase domain-containing protein [Natronoarchaeum philippinense]
MGDTDFHAGKVQQMYDNRRKLYEIGWEKGDHQSIHCGLYDETEHGTNDPFENMIRRLSNTAEVDAGTRVLDIGCGGGDDAVWNARHRDATVVGVDIDDEFLEAAADNAASAGVTDQVSFRNDDFHELASVNDRTYDVVWGLEAIGHSANKSRVFERCRQVLDDGGRLAIGDLFARSDTPVDDAGRRIDILENSMCVRIDTVEKIETALADAGFENIEILDITEAVKPGLKKSYLSSLFMYPLSSLLRRLGRATDSVVGFYRGSYHMYKLLSKGALGYYFVTADRA